MNNAMVDQSTIEFVLINNAIVDQSTVEPVLINNALVDTMQRQSLIHHSIVSTKALFIRTGSIVD